MNVFDALPTLHFVRAEWLWALLLLPAAAWWWHRRQRRASAWRGLVDPHLLPALLDTRPGGRGRLALGAMLLGLALAIVALAGPAWRKVEHPLWQTQAPLVVALDLSSAMLANDLPPNRLVQARAKLATLLRERAGGQVGLVAHAGDAFTVAPLTADADNVAVFLDSLAPDVMPVDGQRNDRAIRHGAELLRRAGFRQGRILLLTDHADAAARAAAAEAQRDGYAVSVLGLGTAAGAPYRDAQGRIGQAKLDAASLRALAAAGGGRYATLAPDLSDLGALGALDPQPMAGDTTRGTAGASWRDEGYWLLPPLALLALFAFRRGAGMAAAALLLCVALPARAAGIEGTPWRRADQVAHARMERGAEAYRGGDFEGAAQAYAGLEGADAHYNHGNALAKLGRYDEAIAAYDRALAAQPGMPDAIANRRAVENARKRQQQGEGDRKQARQPSGDSRSGKGDGDPQSQGSPGQQQGQEQAGSRKRQRPSAQPSAGEAPSGGAQPPAAAAQADPQAQRRADAAQRERMQRALARQRAGRGAGAREAEAPARAETPEQRERRLANQAWLRRVPDDPGGLLRARFRLEYERRQREGVE
jgi:Ca-activated chloride channel family protein